LSAETLTGIKYLRRTSCASVEDSRHIADVLGPAANPYGAKGEIFFSAGRATLTTIGCALANVC
jgi:hypothetical protein